MTKSELEHLQGAVYILEREEPTLGLQLQALLDSNPTLEHNFWNDSLAQLVTEGILEIEKLYDLNVWPENGNWDLEFYESDADDIGIDSLTIDSYDSKYELLDDVVELVKQGYHVDHSVLWNFPGYEEKLANLKTKQDDKLQ